MIPNKPLSSPLNDAYDLLADPEDDKQWLVRLKKDPWLGLVYKYRRFKLIEDKKNDRLICKYEWDILQQYLPARLIGKNFADEKGKELETLVGDIAIELFKEKIGFKD